MQRRLRLRGGAADFFHQASTVLQGERARMACVPRRCCCVVLAPFLGDADPFFSFLFFLPPLGSASGSTGAGRPFAMFCVCMMECANVPLHARGVRVDSFRGVYV